VTGPLSECCFASAETTRCVVAALLVCRESEQVSSVCDVVVVACRRWPSRYVLRFTSSHRQFGVKSGLHFTDCKNKCVLEFSPYSGLFLAVPVDNMKNSSPW
jgi:hypothetical protein